MRSGSLLFLLLQVYFQLFKQKIPKKLRTYNEITIIFLFLKEMIIDKVKGQVVPRYLIYDIVKFNVSIHIFFCLVRFVVDSRNV